MSTERKSCADCIFIVLAILDTSFFLHYNAILLLIQYNCIDISLISMHLSKHLLKVVLHIVFVTFRLTTPTIAATSIPPFNINWFYALINKFVLKNVPSYNSASKSVHLQIFSLTYYKLNPSI